MGMVRAGLNKRGQARASQRGHPGSARSMAVCGSHAYLGDGRAGLEVLDIADPAAPWIVGSVEMTGGQRLSTSGTHAYVVSHVSGFEVVDVTASANPRIVDGGRAIRAAC